MSCTKKSNESSHKQPPPVPQSNELEELDLQLLYNDYLQVLYERELVKLDIEKKKQAADEQSSHYEKILEEKQEAVQKIDDEINLLQKKSAVIESLNCPVEKVLNIDYLNMESCELKKCLQEECKKVKLKNIETLRTQDEVNMLCNTFNNLREMLEDLKNVTRNSAEVHDYAQQIEKFLDLQQKTGESMTKQGKNNDELVRATITKLSNAFAERYMEQPDTEYF